MVDLERGGPDNYGDDLEARRDAGRTEEGLEIFGSTKEDETIEEPEAIEPEEYTKEEVEEEIEAHPEPLNHMMHRSIREYISGNPDESRATLRNVLVSYPEGSSEITTTVQEAYILNPHLANHIDRYVLFLEGYLGPETTDEIFSEQPEETDNTSETETSETTPETTSETTPETTPEATVEAEPYQLPEYVDQFHLEEMFEQAQSENRNQPLENIPRRTITTNEDIELPHGAILYVHEGTTITVNGNIFSLQSRANELQESLIAVDRQGGPVTEDHFDHRGLSRTATLREDIFISEGLFPENITIRGQFDVYMG